MKIFIIFPKDSEALFNKKSTRTFGGASAQLYNIANELAHYSEIKTYCIIPAYNTIDFKDNQKFNLIKLYNELDNSIIKMLKMVKFLITLKPDFIIQRGLTLESCFLALICKLFHVKMVFMFAHDVEVEGLRQRDKKPILFFRILLNNAHILITQNSHQKNKLIKNYKKNSIIIYNGYSFTKNKNSKKEYVLWVARCDRWKQPELFMELAKRNKAMQFVMICPQSSGKEYFSNIKNKSNDIENMKFIEFVHYDEIMQFFYKSSLFVNTSLYEGFPNTFIQAFMSSTPVLSLHVNPDEIITKYGCGIFCNGDFELMNRGLHRLYEDKAFYKKLAQNAFNYAKNFHDIKINVYKLVSILYGQI